MNATDLLRGELERLFELDELFDLSADLLDVDPDEIGGTEGKRSFARALVEHCAGEGGLAALADAMRFCKAGVRDDVAGMDHTGGPQPAAGQSVGGFRILMPLGHGGSGRVYLAEEQDSKRRVALRVVRTALALGSATQKRFMTRMRVLRGVQHPGVAAVLGVGTLEGCPWVASVFVEGRTLAQRISALGPLHVRDACDLFVPILDGLSALHRCHLAHGDVRVENVFLPYRSSSGSTESAEPDPPAAILIDAGLSMLGPPRPASSSETGWMPLFGAPKGVAPELARTGRVDALTDLYAMGCLVYEVLTGRPPFIGPSAFDVVAGHLAGEVEPPSRHAPTGWVDAAIDAVVQRALSKDPSARFPTAEAMKEALLAAARGRPEPSQPSLDEAALAECLSSFAEAPADPARAAAVEALLLPAGQARRAVEAFAAALPGLASDAERKAVLYRIARLETAALGALEAAAATYRTIAEIDPADPVARAAIERNARERGDREALLDSLLDRAEQAPTRKERQEIFWEIAELYETAAGALGEASADAPEPGWSRAEAVDGAFVAWVQALLEVPGDPTSIEGVERVGSAVADRATERWHEALSTLVEAAERDEDVGRRVQLYTLAGRWYVERVHRPDLAIACLDRALKLDPDATPAWDATEMLYRRAEAWPELVALLLGFAERAGGELLAAKRKAEGARILYQKLNRVDQARTLLEEVTAEDPCHPGAEVLLALLDEAQDWPALAALLEAQAQAQRGLSRPSTFCRLGELYEDRLDDLERAAAAYESALRLDDTCLLALKGLERIHARSSHYHALLANLERQLALSPTPRQRVGLYERIGAIRLEEFMDPERAIEAFRSILALAPGHEGANAGLARAYRQLQRHEALCETLEQHARVSADPSRKVALLVRAAGVLAGDIGAPDRALAVVDQALRIEPDHLGALSLAARVKAQLGDLEQALATTDRLLAVESDPTRRAELLLRTARMAQQRGDSDSALERYKRALDADPSNLSAFAAIRTMLTARGDTEAALAYLKREILHTQGEHARAQRFADLGDLHRINAGGREEAVEAYRQALALDPTCTRAELGLGDLAWDRESLAEAASHYDPLLCRSDELDGASLRRVALRCGEAFWKAGSADRAERAYRIARRADPTCRLAHQRAAELAMARGDAAGAAARYRSLLELGPDAGVEASKPVSDAERGALLIQFGQALQQAGAEDEARTALLEAEALLPGDDPAQREVAGFLVRGGDWTEVARSLMRRAKRVAGQARAALLIEASQVFVEHMNDRTAAAEALLGALEIRGEDRNLLSRLMEVYSDTHDWPRLVEVLRRLGELVDRPDQAAKYLHAAGSVCRRELADLDAALSYFEAAVARCAECDKAFDAWRAVLTERADWDALARAYLFRIERLVDPASRAAHFVELGRLHETRGSQPAEAVSAYEAALALHPRTPGAGAALERLYAAHPERYGNAARRLHRAWIAESPFRVASYRALYRLEEPTSDAARCALQALTVLRAADAAEQAQRLASPPGPALHAAAPVEAEVRALLMHPRLDPVLTQLMATILPAFLPDRPADPSAEAVAPGTDRGPALPWMQSAAMLLDVSMPPLHRQRGVESGLTFVFGRTPAIGVGDAVDKALPEGVLAFVAARHLSYFQPGHLMRMVASSPRALHAAVLATARLVGREMNVAESLAAEVEACERRLARLDPQAHTGIADLLAALVEREGALDTEQWCHAVDRTADRVGFALANDLGVAASLVCVGSEPSPRSMIHYHSRRRTGGMNPPSARPFVEDTSASPPPGRTNIGPVALGPTRSELANHAPSSRLSALLAFSVSEGYLRFRKAVGLS